MVDAMTDALSKTAEDALAEFRHYQALAAANHRKADAAIDLFLRAVSAKPGSAVPMKTPECVRVWARWLKANGPNTRAHITEATGRKFTERGTPHTVLYDDLDDADDDDLFPPNTIVRFTGYRPQSRRGASNVIYALWSQRYEVRPLFGVGPERGEHANSEPEPEPEPAPIVTPTVTDPSDPMGGFDHLSWAERIVAEREAQSNEPAATESEG